MYEPIPIPIARLSSMLGHSFPIALNSKNLLIGQAEQPVSEVLPPISSGPPQPVE